MLMPLLEYNKHIAKIPNCKMRSLRAWMQQMLLLLLLLFGHSDVIRALDTTDNGNNNGGIAGVGGGGGSGSGSSSSGSAPGAAGPAVGGPPGALNANLTDLGSPVTNFSNANFMCYYNLIFRRLLTEDSIPTKNETYNFGSIDSANTFWDFVSHRVLPLLDTGDFKTYDPSSIYKIPNQTSLYDPFYGNIVERNILHGNILLGPPRLRQIRVRPVCTRNSVFLKHMPPCYPPYSIFNEQRADTGGEKWVSMWEAGSLPICGELNLYLGAGFIRGLGYNYSENVRLVESLRESNWIARDTRIVLFEFNLFHVYTNLFEKIQLRLERSSYGTFTPSYDFRVIRRHTLFNDHRIGKLFVAYAYSLMILAYTGREILIITRIGLRLYLRSFINIVDVFCCLFSYVFLITQMVHNIQMGNIMYEMRTSDKFISLDLADQLNTAYSNFVGLTVLLVFVRVLTYFTFTPTLQIFARMMNKCIHDFFGLSLLFLAVLMAYAEWGRVLFGNHAISFARLGNALLSVVRMAVQTFNYDELRAATHGMIARFYYISYVLTVYQILVFEVMGIITSSYVEIKDTAAMQKPKLWQVVGLFLRSLYDLFYCMFHCKRKRRLPLEKGSLTELPLPSKPSSPGAAQRAARRRNELQNPIMLSQNEYLPGRMSRALKRIRVLEEITGPLLGRLVEYQNGLRAQQGLPPRPAN